METDGDRDALQYGLLMPGLPRAEKQHRSGPLNGAWHRVRRLEASGPKYFLGPLVPIHSLLVNAS